MSGSLSCWDAKPLQALWEGALACASLTSCGEKPLQAVEGNPLQALWQGAMHANGCCFMRSCCDWQPQIHRGIWFGPLATPLPIIMSGYRQKLKMAQVDRTDLGRVAPVPEAVRPSVLASKLRSLWASGHISGLAVQELSMASLLDGVHGNDIAHLAAFGAFGEQPGNAARDTHRHMSKNIMLPLPHGVQVPCMDPSSGEYAQEQAYMFLPHEVFSALGNHYPEEFVAMFNTAETPKFWQGLSQRDPRLYRHPLLQCDSWQFKHIPCYIHGDGVEYQQRDSLLAYSWGSLLSTGA